MLSPVGTPPTYVLRVTAALEIGTMLVDLFCNLVSNSHCNQSNVQRKQPLDSVL